MRRIRIWHLVGLALSVPLLAAAAPPGCYGGLNPSFVNSVGADPTAAVAPPAGYVGILLLNKTIHQVQVDVSVTSSGFQTTRTFSLESAVPTRNDTVNVVGFVVPNAAEPSLGGFFGCPVTAVGVSQATVYGFYQFQWWFQPPTPAGGQVPPPPVLMTDFTTQAEGTQAAQISTTNITNPLCGTLVVIEILPFDAVTNVELTPQQEYQIEHNPAALPIQGPVNARPAPPGAPVVYQAIIRVL